MTNMGMASGRKVHPLYFFCICVTEKRSGDDIRQTFLQYLECQVNLYRAMKDENKNDMNIDI